MAAHNDSQIPIDSYLVLSSTERVARFSESVIANGSTVGGNVSTHDICINLEGRSD